MSDPGAHIPVMATEVQEHLNLPSGGCLVDCTVGLGGHSGFLAAQLGAQGRIIAIDRDRESLELARANLRGCGVVCDFVHDDFRHVDRVLEDLKVSKVDGMLFDLGISSFQLDDAHRGFSLRGEGPLDMRMNQESYISAYDLVNSLSEKEISQILRDYGEERWHNRIAHHLVAQRSRKPIETTGELCDAVLHAIPHGRARQKIHPATRTFQAFRIAVNRELESLEIALDKCLPFLKSGARLCVIAFHSLEDRIVKQSFRLFFRTGQVRLVVKKPLRPTDKEIECNPRARSARMRVVEKIS